MDKFNFAGKRTLVQIGPHHLIVVLHSYTYCNGMIKYLLLCAHFDESGKNKPPYIACGYSIKEDKIIPLESMGGLGNFLKQLILYAKEKLEELEGLSLTKIEKTIDSITKKDSIQYAGELVPLDPNLFVLLDSSVVKQDSCQCKVSWGDCVVKAVEIVAVSGQDAFEKMSLTCDVDSDEYKKIDARDYIQIQFDTGQELEISGTYYPIEIMTNSYSCTLTVICGNFSEEFKNTKIPLLSAVMCEAGDLIDLICRTQGLPEENINIEGFNKEGYYSFTVIFPISNIVFSKPIGIGMVNYVTGLEDFLNKRLQHHVDNFDNSIWSNKFAKAQVNLTAKTFFEAYIQGSEYVEESLDLLTHLARQSMLYENYSSSDTLVHWQRDVEYPRPFKSTMAFIVNNTTAKSMLFDGSKSIDPNILNVDLLSNRLSGFMGSYELSMIYTYPGREIEKKKRDQFVALTSALRWLRRGWEADKVEDQIIYIVTALEYSMAGVRGTSFLPKATIARIVSGAVNSYKDLVIEYNDEIIKILENKIYSSLRNPPLRNRVLAVIAELDIPITKTDLTILHRVRVARNNLIHEGEKRSISSEETKKAHSVVSRIIAARIAKLIQDGVQ